MTAKGESGSRHLLRRARWAVQSSYWGLLFLLTVNLALYGPATVAATAVAWLVQTLPLLILLPGLLKGRYRSHIWMCFVVLIYFVAVVPSLFSPGVKVYDYLMVATTVVLFIGSMLLARWQLTLEQSTPNSEQGVLKMGAEKEKQADVR